MCLTDDATRVSRVTVELGVSVGGVAPDGLAEVHLVRHLLLPIPCTGHAISLLGTASWARGLWVAVLPRLTSDGVRDRPFSFGPLLQAHNSAATA